MAIPDFQSLMLPVLKITSDGQDHGISEIQNNLAKEFGLSEEDVRELLPSGRQPRFCNRIGWALTYLKKAGLLEGVGRGKFRITQRGFETLKENPLHLDMKYLERFSEFRQFRGLEKSKEDGEKPLFEEPLPPDERLELVYQELNQELAQEFLERIKGCSPDFFESLVLKLLLRWGMEVPLMT